MYSRVLAVWMDIGDLATYNNRSGLLKHYEPLTQLRERDLAIRSIRRAHLLMPAIQYSPVEKVALLIASSLEGQRVNWKGIKKSTVQKAFGTLEALHLIRRTDSGYRLNGTFVTLRMEPAEVRQVFALAVTQMPAFQQFLNILQENSTTGCSQLQLGHLLRDALHVEWKDATATTNVKIMLDWARHLGVAPGVFARHPRRKPASEADARAT